MGGAEWEASTMSHAEQVSKRRNRTKAVTVLGVAGALSLTGGTSGAAVGPKVDTPTENIAPVITLGEEEISDVAWRLSTCSTTKTPEHIVPVYKSPRGRAVTGAAQSAEAAAVAR